MNQLQKMELLHVCNIISWIVSILQFWTDNESIADGELFGGWVRLASALAKYVKHTIYNLPT